MRKADEDLETIQISIRMPRDWPERADKLKEKIAPPGMKVTRMDVYRAALDTGFERLEKQKKKKN